MGIYVFNRDILSQRLKDDASRPDSSHDFGYSILPGMVGRDKVNAYEFTGYWQDIGTPQAYYAANMELVCAQPSFSLNHTRTVLTQRLNLPPASIARPDMIVNSLVSPGCVINGRVENSILSPGVRVDEQAEVRNSVLMPNVFVGSRSVVDTCIIDEGVNIGKMSYIGFGKTLLPGDGDITVLGKEVTVPPHTAIGRNCRVFPHANFRGNLVASGSTLSGHSVVQKPCATGKAKTNEYKSIRVA